MVAVTRRDGRELAMHLTFELGFSDLSAEELLERELNPEQFALRQEEDPVYHQFPDKPLREYMERLVRGVFSHGAELDSYIAKYARDWRFSRIDRVAAAIMRVAMYEVLYVPEVPKKVALNEAVELSKKYLDDGTVRFVNGILGSFVRAEFPETTGEKKS